MSKNKNWTLSEANKLGFVETDKGLVRSEKLVAKKVDKISFSASMSDEELNRRIADGTLLLSENKKVRNATKTVVDGITFDSKLEATMYKLLRGADIPFNRQVEYVLQPGFVWHGKRIRPIKSFVDFYLPTYRVIIDCKGYANDVAPLKFKMLKFRLNFEYLKPPIIEMPKNESEAELLINRLLYDDKYKQ